MHSQHMRGNHLANAATQGIEMVWHVERMDEFCIARRVMMSKVSGGRVRGRPRLGCMNDVKVALGNSVNARKIGNSGEP